MVTSPRPPPGPRRFAALARAACPSAPRGGSLSPRKATAGSARTVAIHQANQAAPGLFEAERSDRHPVRAKKKPGTTGHFFTQFLGNCSVGKNVGKSKDLLETRMNTGYLAERAGHSALSEKTLTNQLLRR